MIVLAAGIAIAAVVVSLGWAVLQLMRQQGRLLIDLDELKAQLTALETSIRSEAVAPAPPVGMAPGSAAPEFDLPELDGGSRKLADYRGHATTLLFFDPACGFCAQLAPTLRDVPTPELVVMSRGERNANLDLAHTHGWRGDVLIETGWGVASSYGVHATPTAYRIDAGGRIASHLAMGVDGVIELLGLHAPLSAQSLQRRQESAVERARGAGMAITPSRIRRTGLGAGTPAPDFARDDLHGNPVRLSAMRGRSVLLVFSDPACGSCQEVAPSLQRLYEAHRRDGLQVLMVSRGDHATNVEKVHEHGLTFPVVLQDGWEISMQYGIFATPVGYLIDEQGAIANQVAIGAEAILSLFASEDVALTR